MEYQTACRADSARQYVQLASTLTDVVVRRAVPVSNARLSVQSISTRAGVGELQRAAACRALLCAPVDSM